MVEWFRESLKEKGILLTNRQEEQFHKYYELLREWNQRMNLTAITDETGVYEKHFYDSLTPLFNTPFKADETLLDIGAGAGFPSFPIKIIYPDLSLVIIDSLKKRLTFLEEVIKELQLTSITLIHGRAEEVGRVKEHREKYPIVTARAVARLNILLEYTLPFVQVGGIFIAMKGKSIDQELKEAEHALKVLKGEVMKIDKEILPIEQSERNLIWIKKTGNIPAQYPRNTGAIEKKPL